MNLKIILLVVVLFVLLNVIGYLTRPDKYRKPAVPETTPNNSMLFQPESGIAPERLLDRRDYVYS
jgi:hypothetical protein